MVSIYNYIDINRTAYDNLAKEFNNKRMLRKGNTKRIINKFEYYLKEQKGKRILELGPAAGNDTRELIERGYNVDGIELSTKLAEICKKNVPRSNIIVGDFLSHKFKNKYDGILAIAFIHLFPKTDTTRVFKKIHSLLRDNGIAYISTTIHKEPKEGFEVKNNFKRQDKRFRRRFTKEELENLVSGDFKVLSFDSVLDNEERNKIWGDYIIQKIN